MQFFVSFLLVLFGMSFAPVFGATLPFRFSLDEATTTSAGIFSPEGRLVRTLWRKVDFEKGDHTSTWDGMNDEKLPAPAGDYSVKILSHHVSYWWDGAIGNTSAEPFGSTVHRGFGAMVDMVITGNDAFYITGYCEGDFDFRHFLTNNPQKVEDRWCWYYNERLKRNENRASNIYDSDWISTDSDGERVWFAAPDSTIPVTREMHAGPGFIVASYGSSHQSASFEKGQRIPNGPEGFPDYPNGIRVGTKKGLLGLAVQKTGPILAASVGPENKVYLFDKISGAEIRNITISNPGRLAFAPDGSLWAVSGTEIKRIADPASDPKVSTPIGGLLEPLDIAINPSGTLIAVIDAGSSQQVKCYQLDGTPTWTLGQAGGYEANGPMVTRDKFFFRDREWSIRGSLTFASDGSLWVNDPGNRRTLHFDVDQKYLEEIMFQNVSYSAAANQTDAARIYSNFMEFEIDYTKPLAQGWKLTKNWGATLPRSFFGLDCGLRQVTTLTNGRTYAMASDETTRGREMLELTTEGIRCTGLIFKIPESLPGHFEVFLANGNLRRASIFDSMPSKISNSEMLVEERSLSGFNDAGNPQWGGISRDRFSVRSATGSGPSNLWAG